MVECECLLSFSSIREHLVLIDTWWNVNVKCAFLTELIMFCFNRYMVECEFSKQYKTITYEDRFNRYMVECEFFSHEQLSKRRKGFNRYMVECEYFIHHKDSYILFVLIDTWWNVNLINEKCKTTGAVVLIDTWWNVNELADSTITGCMSFNRYMVECECFQILKQHP